MPVKELSTESTLKSIAVLPFGNLSANLENEYFCDGITEEIIGALAGIPELKVTSRTSSFYFKNQSFSIQEIGHKLAVSHILEGSVRVAGKTLRISAKLISVEHDSSFWSQTWDRPLDNIFEIQDEISLQIAEKIREYVGHLELDEHLAEPRTQNLRAHELILKGRYLFNQWNPEDANIAIEEFEKALIFDNEAIDAYLGIADAYSFLAVAGFAPREAAWSKAIEAINKAKNINPENARLNYMLANQAFFTEGNYTKAFEYSLRSLKNKPNFSENQQFLSFLYALSGDLNKSKEHLLYAKSVDPLNPETRFYEAYYYYRSGEDDLALKLINGLLNENPKNIPALYVKIYINIKQKNYTESKRLIEEIPEGLISPDESLGLQCLNEAKNDHSVNDLLDELAEKAKEKEAHHAHAYLFLSYVALGKNEEAFQTLEKLFDEQSSILLLSFSDPLASELFVHPRYMEYHQRIYQINEPEQKPQKTASISLEQAEVSEALEKLRSYMNAEKPFLDPSLSLRSLAAQIEIHPNQLSWILNEQEGKNFNEYINRQRIEHFKKLVLDKSNAHISIIGLAYESGFNSKTVFNTTFKKLEGVTPSQYQKSH
ncbi:MAG: helix-turn-helix domain-containing protein [Cytophagales bacterium]|nr:helix-turn-helix domain-containing protein [Cytophagales bacterium]